MLKNVTIHFFLNDKKANQRGEIPIYVRVILGREKFELSSKQYVVCKTDWDISTGRVRKKTPVNQALSELEVQIKEAYQFLKYSKGTLSVSALRTVLKGSKTERVRLSDFLDHYYRDRVLANKEYTMATCKTYKTCINHLKEYLGSTNRSIMRLTEVDAKFIRGWDNYLVSEIVPDKKALNRNSASKYHTKFKSMLFYAIDTKQLESQPYREFKIKSEQGRLTYLTTAELKRIEKSSLGGNSSLIKVRDIFLFSCYTGLRFGDALSLRSANIIVEGDRYWIEYTQGKTQSANRIPMLQKAVELYDKYEMERQGMDYVLPRISNQKQNVYLKIIAESVGITKPLTHHVARHTNATTILLQNGVSLEETSKFLGHKSVRTTQIYAKVTNQMLGKAADRLDKIFK